MKHLPNLLTLGNLFCGCIAIVYILTAQPYYSMSLGEHGGVPTWQWVRGAEQMYLGSIFIGIAAICDLFDGLTARALKLFSPIGKDLDSLADVVSFGVAPSAILFKFLWDANMGERNAMDVSMLAMVPAFLVACFAALRLAKYNITADSQKAYFIGMPSPAAGMFVASLPLVVWYSPANIAPMLTPVFQNAWALYAIIAVLCWLMVSNVHFFKLLPARWTIAYMWPQLVLVLFSAVAIPFLGFVAIPFGFILYVLLSFVYRQPEAIDSTNTH
jgi:CDP-diacylglycerol--serine O-phosphatidyltransferase